MSSPEPTSSDSSDVVYPARISEVEWRSTDQSRNSVPPNLSRIASFDDKDNGSTSPLAASSRPLLEDDAPKTISKSRSGQPLAQTDGGNHTALVISEQDLAKEREALALLHDTGSDGKIKDNKFAFSPAIMDKLHPKNLTVFAALGGLNGLEIGLRTNRQSGLSLSEDVLFGHVSFKDVETKLAGGDIGSDGALIETRIHSRTSTHSRKRSPEHFTDRKRVFKDNHLPLAPPKTFLYFVWATYNDTVLMLLTAAAAISLAIGLYQAIATPRTPDNPPIEWVEGVAILVAIIIIVLVGSINDFQKDRQFLRLDEKKQRREVKVIRSGKPRQVSIFDILVGDIVCIEPGDVSPADGIFIDGYNVKCDESSVTGESGHVRKHPADQVFRAVRRHESHHHKMDCFIISGSKVVEGVGTFVVTATGTNSSHGRTLASLRRDPEVTPLQQRLERLAKQITKFGIAVALVMFLVLFIKFLATLKHNTRTPTQKGQQFLNILIIALTVLVIAVPEGLPLAVTLSLAFATRKMLRDNNLVRRLQSCETMGSVTTICSDKTGTLTQNKMKVVAGTIGARFALSSKSVESLSREEKLDPGDTEVVGLSGLAERLSDDVKDLLEDSIAINSTAFESEDNGAQGFIGSNTESALLLFARDRLGMGPLAVKRANATIAQVVPFDAARKFMATVVKLANGTYRLYVKGAPEVLLAKCTRIIQDPMHGVSDAQITPEYVSTLEEVVTTYASRSLRTLGLLYRDFEQWPPADVRAVDEDERDVAVDDFLKDLVFLAVVGIQDPLRDDVIKAVQDCQRAGIVVRMVTGDNLWTAKAIAKESGILSSDGEVLEGSAFRALSESDALAVVPRLRVLARSSSEDKRVLVALLKQLGNVVAVTGDGTNDAPALAAADIGLSMGISGTEIAKEAASIILMDDNFSSIVKAIKWGRAINDAVRKFLQFQITVTVTSVTLAFVSAASNSEEQSVLTPVQLMWVNLIQDTLAALALATDPPTPDILDRNPDSKSSPLITSIMWKMIIGQSFYQVAVTLILTFAGRRIFSYGTPTQKAQLETAVFNTYTWLQIFNQWNCRRIDNKLNIFEGMLRNWLFIAITLIMVGGQIIIMFVGGSAFSVTRLTGSQWAYSVVLGVTSLLVGALIRWIPLEKLAKWWPHFRRNDNRGMAAVELI